MHIGFQSSGGRGEYEVVGNHSGYTALGLEGWRFYLGWPDGVVRQTGLELEPATSGKARLRSTASPQFQIGRLLAAMLLLPDPRREFAQTNHSPPVARAKGYVLTRLGFGPATEFSGVADLVTIDPSFVTIGNKDAVEHIGIRPRWARIQQLYDRAEELPETFTSLLHKHREYLASGVQVTSELTLLVSALVRQVGAAGGDGDPLPAMERILGIGADGPALPPPDQIGEEDIEVAIRSASQYRLAKARGPAAVAFRRAVRIAYGNRCAFCGGGFGGIPGIASGVDAAHILAWHRYDLDVVDNGIALCKIHHWAFDAAIMLPIYRGGDLYVSFTERADLLDGESKNILGDDGVPIDPLLLPASKLDWPSERYLEHLYADLAISFSP